MKPSVSLQVSSYLTAPCVARTDCEVSCGNLAYLNSMTNSTLTLRKEVIQPHLPIRLPCYDFTPVTSPAFDSSLQMVRSLAFGITDSHGVTGGVYKTRARIHRIILMCDYWRFQLHIVESLTTILPWT